MMVEQCEEGKCTGPALVARGYWHTENGFDELASAVIIPDEPTKRKAQVQLAPLQSKQPGGISTTTTTTTINKT